ncbi:MAG TPA: metalloregulator ArsR/SmtB family transcription factor [Methanobacterium sp.]|jgi:ArsR family transcriptional regulator|nr:MAG: winged helix-turn-helix transcriptional regulator [Methanobacterium sp.]HOI71302.1 metalloregulator ArsR/SmtB family transcription factor [Methanobacterium sp.]HPX77560.1 metalloregulator ArsR/SmtB family transcription factor [Methanobacterium sp.]
MKSCEVNSKDKPSCEQNEILKKIISKIPDQSVLNINAEFFKAFGDPTRLKILHLLEEEELCVCEIISALNKPQPTVSHHLNILKKAGLLNWRKEGIWIYYRLSNQNIINNLNEILKKE